jgi:L-glyceraldehyde 3-phosphate reductase
VFYHHRPDPDTPLEETMLALADIVRQGKALYVGISNYDAKQSVAAFKLLREYKVPVILHQARYSMLDRWVEEELLDVLDVHGIGCVAFSPLAQGQLSDKYINGIPKNSRATKPRTYLEVNQIQYNIEKIKALNKIALSREQKLSQMAIAWLLRKPQVSSVLVGASSANQLKENVKSLENKTFSENELNEIEAILKSS